MFAVIEPNYAGACGITMLKNFKQPGRSMNGWGDMEKYKSITMEGLLKCPGARILQAAFIKDEKDSDDMFAYLTETLGLSPAYISPVRPNTNMPARKPFYTVVFELPERK